MSTPYGLPSTWSSIPATSISSDTGVKLAPPSTPKPPARLTAATTSRQWLKANSGKSTPTRSRMTFMPVSIHVGRVTELYESRHLAAPHYVGCGFPSGVAASSCEPDLEAASPVILHDRVELDAARRS